MCNWPSGVNRNFFGLTTTVKENVKTIEFESGTKRTYLKNTTPKKKYSVSLSLWSKNEEVAFWNWYNDTILSGSLTFAFSDFTTQDRITEYRLVSVPSISGQYPKTLTLQIEEV